MEFGLLPTEMLPTIDFRLRKEPAGNREILSGKKAKKASVYLGCAKWGRKEWLGKLYPLKTREKDFLSEYVKHFNSIELNATHYKIIGARGIAAWKKKTGDQPFLFCPKMYQGVSHRGNLKTKNFLLNEFFRGILAFGDSLGPIFIQFQDRFGPKRKEELFDFLRGLPKDLSFFVELRHRDWFADAEVNQALLSLLRSLNMGIVITDAAGRRDVCHMELTIPKTFIRFVGNNLDPTDYTRCDEWVKRIKYWLGKGMTDIYFFMHMHDEAFTPELAFYLAKALNEKCKLDLHTS